ncbi:Fatty acid synthase [Halotydeus destructor]|nr:Fatty acid synthase [Halotydeus destructor]
MADKCPIAITGLSGRFPSADDLEQFKNNLFNGVDMVTSDDIRWPQGLWGLPPRNGKVASMDKFDSEFFGVPEDQVRAMDPQERLLYELTYECLLDAGLRPEALGQTNTGCYHGSCMRAPNAELLDPEKVSGHVNRMVTRVSRYLKIRGPVFQADSACASGLTAFNQAYHAVRAGVCDQALVLAYNNILRPRISVNFMRMKMNSQDGRCKCLDKSANGYVRAEALVVLLLQKVDQAHRVHSVVLNSGSNCDGYTEEGVTFPSVSGQRALIRDTYNQINLDPVRIKYIEAHMTGTQAGDYVESTAIHDYFFNGGHRTEPLLMGCLKSSIGHSEGASGLCSLAKALIVHKEGKNTAKFEL